jgi:hypothetical protein
MKPLRTAGAFVALGSIGGSIGWAVHNNKDFSALNARLVDIDKNTTACIEVKAANRRCEASDAEMVEVDTCNRRNLRYVKSINDLADENAFHNFDEVSIPDNRELTSVASGQWLLAASTLLDDDGVGCGIIYECAEKQKSDYQVNESDCDSAKASTVKSLTLLRQRPAMLAFLGTAVGACMMLSSVRVHVPSYAS